MKDDGIARSMYDQDHTHEHEHGHRHILQWKIFSKFPKILANSTKHENTELRIVNLGLHTDYRKKTIEFEILLHCLFITFMYIRVLFIDSK